MKTLAIVTSIVVGSLLAGCSASSPSAPEGDAGALSDTDAASYVDAGSRDAHDAQGDGAARDSGPEDAATPLDAAPAACPLSGRYVLHFTETTNQCGPIPDETFTVTPGSDAGAVSSSCGGALTVAADGCTVSGTLICAGSKGTESGSLDGVAMKARISIAGDGGFRCAGTYAVTETKQ